MNQENTINKNNAGGVKTEEGKAITRYNAQKHSIFRETITDYEKADFEKIYNDLYLEFQPSSVSEKIIIEILASNYVRLFRVAKAESEVIKTEMHAVKYKISKDEYMPLVSSDVADKLVLYSRYQTATENRIYRALSALNKD